MQWHLNPSHVHMRSSYQCKPDIVPPRLDLVVWRYDLVSIHFFLAADSQPPNRHLSRHELGLLNVSIA